MFNEFGVNSSFFNLNEIDELCMTEFSDFYLGAVYYTSRDATWKEKLKNFIENNK